MIKSFSQFMHSEGDRSSHLSWGPEDVRFRVAESEDLSHVPDLVLPTKPKVHLPSREQLSHWDAHRETFDPDHHNHVFQFKFDSASYNDHLRGIRGQKAEGYKHLDHVTSCPTKEPLVVYRGYRKGFPIHHLKPGAEFHDDGYTGTSFDYKVAHDRSYVHKEWQDGSPSRLNKFHTVGKIHVPAGTKGFFLDHRGDTPYSDEQEFAFHRGTHFRVMKHTLHQWKHVDEDGWHTNYRAHIIHLEVSGQHPKKLDHD